MKNTEKEIIKEMSKEERTILAVAICIIRALFSCIKNNNRITKK